jgi:hypothetical protein
VPKVTKLKREGFKTQAQVYPSLEPMLLVARTAANPTQIFWDSFFVFSWFCVLRRISEYVAQAALKLPI